MGEVVTYMKCQTIYLERSIKSMQSDLDVCLTLAEEENDISYLDTIKEIRNNVWEKEDSVRDLKQTIEKVGCELRNLKWLSA